MLHARDLAGRRQQLVEMAAPACRILPVTVAADLGPVQNLLNPPADTGRSYRLCALDWLKCLHNQIGPTCVVQLSNRYVANRGIDMLRKRSCPCFSMTDIRPCRPL
jgi:hypothetical protein